MVVVTWSSWMVELGGVAAVICPIMVSGYGYNSMCTTEREYCNRVGRSMSAMATGHVVVWPVLRRSRSCNYQRDYWSLALKMVPTERKGTFNALAGRVSRVLSTLLTCS
jgi:hypothetical protein